MTEHDQDHLSDAVFRMPVPEPYEAPLLGAIKDKVQDAVLGAVGSTPPNFVSRAQWGAKPGKNVSTNITPGKGGVAWHYEGPKMGTWSHDKCAGKVRQIQAFHMGPQRGWADIAYTALVCPHGYIFEGRGTGKRTAAQGTNDGNQRYYAICGLLGEGDALTSAMLNAYVAATQWLREAGGAGLGVRPHRSFHSTSCPGDLVAAQVSKYDGKVIKGTTGETTGPKDTTKVPTPTPPAPTTGHNHGTPTLQAGSSGGSVQDLQGHLNYAFKPYPNIARLETDGVWGDRTTIRFREWQKRTGLPVDGVCGPKSWARLHEVTAGRRLDYAGKEY